MRHFKTIAIGLVALSTWATISHADITTAAPNEVGNCNNSMFANCDSMPDQVYNETPNDSLSSGNWANLTGGVSSRPYVTRLSVSNGGVETVLLEGGTTASLLSDTAGSVGMVIAPVNLCKSGQTPAPGVCYATPNRVTASLVYRKQTGEVGYNFSFPNDGNLGGVTGNSVTLKSSDGSTSVTIDENTVIDATIALNTLGQSLRWTWLNGIPEYWNTTDLGASTATIRVKFKLARKPAINWQQLPSDPGGCTAIPVLSCEIEKSHSDWLAGDLILSLDDTLDEGMTGALFATEQAVIGSVTTSTTSTSTQLTYGLSSSHNDYTGTPRSATLRALIPGAAVVQLLGLPSFSESFAGLTLPSDLLSVAREGSDASFSTTFERWTAADNGGEGVLMTVSGVTFSAPQFKLSNKASGVKKPSVSLSNGQYSLTVKTSGSVNQTCKSKACSVGIYRTSSSKLSAVLTKLASVKTTKTSGVASAVASFKKTRLNKKGAKLLVVVRSKAGKIIGTYKVTLNK